MKPEDACEPPGCRFAAATCDSHQVTASVSARDLWVASRAAGDAGKWALGERLALRALQALSGDDGDLRIRVLIALSYHQSEQGRLGEATAVLDQAALLTATVPPPVRIARGMMKVRTGRPDEALADLDRGVLELVAADRSARHRDPVVADDLAGALINRGLLHLTAGRLAEARRDTERAAQIAVRLGRSDIQSIADHNLGYVDYLAGDLPGALAAMTRAAQRWDGLAETSALDRARVLTAAGLVTEARELIEDAIAGLAANNATADLVDAYAIRATISLLVDDPDAARADAKRSARLSRRRGNTVAAEVAEVIALRADRASRRRDAGLPGVRTARSRPPTAADPVGPIGLDRRLVTAHLRRSGVVVARLRETGQSDELRAALLLHADTLLDCGRTDAARAVIEEALRLPGTAALAVRLHQQLVRARIDLADGRRAAGLGRLARGLDELSVFQAGFGAPDLQAAAAVHGRELAQLGLWNAVQAGTPAEIFRWSELVRGVGDRLPVVRPPADPQLAGSLADLRATADQLRQTELAGDADAATRARLSRLRRQVQAQAWATRGKGRAERPLSLAVVQQRLAAHPDGPTAVAYLLGRGELVALTITAESARFQRLCQLTELESVARRVSADLDLLATARVPARVRQVARMSLSAGLARLAELILRPLGPAVADRPILVSAVGLVATLPWGQLPPLHGRPVAVSSSISRALRTPAVRAGVASRMLAVAGPGLPHSEREVQAVAGLYRDAESLTGGRATGDGVLDRMPAGGLLHIAAHGSHERDSPLFSSVLLADGPLYGYDIAPRPALPAQVVLSACQVGRHDVLVGEPLGLAAALLRTGVGTVVAGVNLVADEVATAVMTDYHRALSTGAAPAVALAGAVAQAPEPAAFGCFGAGL